MPAKWDDALFERCVLTDVTCQQPSTAKLRSFHGWTVKIAALLGTVTPFCVKGAVILVVPAGPEVVAKPKLVMTAICGSEEVQFAKRVMLCVLLSLKVPTAVNACEPPIGMLALPGEMVI